jgi:hypothetical protein
MVRYDHQAMLAAAGGGFIVILRSTVHRLRNRKKRNPASAVLPAAQNRASRIIDPGRASQTSCRIEGPSSGE